MNTEKLLRRDSYLPPQLYYTHPSVADGDGDTHIYCVHWEGGGGEEKTHSLMTNRTGLESFFTASHMYSI